MSDTPPEPWRQLVDTDRLLAWMDSLALGQGPIENAQVLSGGTQNVLLQFDRAGRSYVLRRPPNHPRMDGSQTMRREARVLAALAHTEVPHPHLIAACDDTSVLGCGFYLMEPVSGYTATSGLPSAAAADPVWRERMGLSMVEALAQLGRVDHEAVGLADFGKLDGFLQRQAGRWQSQLQSYADYAGWPGASGLPDVDHIATWLNAHVPASFQPGIVHGDYHLSNVMFRHDAPAIAAIVDWEMSTLGAPLLDLGWMLATWPDAQGGAIVPKVTVTPWQGFPDAQALVQCYAKHSNRDLSDLNWYAVLACYKLAIVLEGTYARAHAGKASMAIGQPFHDAARLLLQRAQTWLQR